MNDPLLTRAPILPAGRPSPYLVLLLAVLAIVLIPSVALIELLA